MYIIHKYDIVKNYYKFCVLKIMNDFNIYQIYHT